MAYLGTLGGGMPRGYPSCMACRQPIADGQRATRIDFRTDPDGAGGSYWDWMIHHASIIFAAQAIAAQFAATFRDFPPRQKAASFTIDQAMAKLSEATSGAGH